MKDWLINLIVEFILKSISDDKIQDLAKTVKSYLIPFLVEQKDELIRRLVERAAETDTEIDDAAYRALDVFLSEFIPEAEAIETAFAQVSRNQVA